jgi:hypothetical protein
VQNTMTVQPIYAKAWGVIALDSLGYFCVWVGCITSVPIVSEVLCPMDLICKWNSQGGILHRYVYISWLYV